MKPIIKVFMLLFSLFFLSSCESAGSSLSSDDIRIAKCEKSPEVITSTREFIRLRHSSKNFDKTSILANKWCGSFNSKAERSVSSCSGCCVTAFQCR